MAEFEAAFPYQETPDQLSAIDALKRVRTEVESKLAEGVPIKPPPVVADEPLPDRTAKFESKGIEGDISKLVGGATDKPVPSAPKKIEPKGAVGAGSSLSSLKAAKQRAQQKIREQEKGDG